MGVEAVVDEALDDLLIMGFFEEGGDAFCDDGADAFDVEKVFYGGVHERFEGLKVLGEVF